MNQINDNKKTTINNPNNGANNAKLFPIKYQYTYKVQIEFSQFNLKTNLLLSFQT